MSVRKRTSLFGIPLLMSALILSLVIIFGFSSKKPKLVTNIVEDFSGKYDKTANVGLFLGEKVNVPSEIKINDVNRVLGESSPDNKWIDVDLSEQKLKAWEGNSLFLESLVSTGLPWWPTPTGEFRIWYKTRYTRMKGGSGKYAYNLPNVPYTMFFENGEVPSSRGYGLHGTYWHNDFGKVHSHGCVNLPTPIAEKLYYWTTPVLGTSSLVRSSGENPGTRIVIHD